MENREELIRTLLKHFLNDLSASAKPLTQEENIEFMGILADYLKGVYNDELSIAEYNYEGNPFDSEEYLETHLLKPYREKMVPFVKSGLKHYFSKDEYGKTLLFQKLKVQEPILNEEEYDAYISRIYTLLQQIKENLYLRPVEQLNIPKAEAESLIGNHEQILNQGFKSQSTQYTRSRQVLLFYFVLKLMGLSRLDNSARKYAQFAHALFAWPIDNIDNSGVYKMLKKAPYLKKDKNAQLKDLEFVKTQFELIDHKQGVVLVQKEIELISR